MDRTSILERDRDLAESASRGSAALPAKSHLLSMFCSSCPELALYRPGHSEKNQSESIFRRRPLGPGRGATIHQIRNLSMSFNVLVRYRAGASPPWASSLHRDSPDRRLLNFSQCFGPVSCRNPSPWPSSLRRDSPDPRSLNVSQCFSMFWPFAPL